MPLALHAWVVRRWLLFAVAGLLAVASCGRAPQPLPTAPTGVGGVSTHVTPVPLAVRRVGSTGPTAAYELTGRVTFRVTGEERIRLVALELVLRDDEGILSRHELPVDVSLNAGTDAAVAFPGAVPALAARVPTRLVIRASGFDHTGNPYTVPPFEVPLSMAAPGAVAGSADATFVGAGDIGNCALPGAALTARLLQSIPGSVFTLGDHVYPSSTAEAFSTCYESTWGALKGRTYPAPGNHDWDEDRGRPYFEYFGPASRRGYYSFDLGAWHILSLNSNIDTQPGSQQYQWVQSDLATHSNACTLAYWHHPVFSSGSNGNNPHMRAMWKLLDEAGVDLVMAAHDHLYERFSPQDADGRPTAAGMREFVVGTGGAALYGMPSPRPNSEVRNNQGWGVLKLTLRGAGYEWQFVPVAGHSFHDAGSASCGF